MKCKIPQTNPFICHTGSDHVAGTVSNVEQSLSLLQNALCSGQPFPDTLLRSFS